MYARVQALGQGRASPWWSRLRHCTGERGANWATQSRLLPRERGLSASALARTAKEVGLGVARFRAGLDAGRYGAPVPAGLSEGAARGVRRPPTFVLGVAEARGQ